MTFDVEKIRKDFPALSQKVHGKPLVYLDNAASAQTPQQVIDAMQRFYVEERANIHRGVHQLSMKATKSFEAARTKAARFLNAKHLKECIFVKGTTDGINLVAQTYGRKNIKKGDEILISAMEHHSNIVPWQMLCEEKEARLRVIPMNDQGELLLEEFEKLLTPQVKLLALVHVSNALGTVNPIKAMTAMAHAKGVTVLIDGAQAVPHLTVDVQDIDCDFYVFSGHKLYGPTGIGILYGKSALLEAMPPYQGGGDMITSVTFEKTTYNSIPHKFEAGTPDIAGGFGLSATFDYLRDLDFDAACRYEHSLLEYATAEVSKVPGIRLVGTASNKASVLSFLLADIHPHDLGTILDHQGIAIRTGHHCAQPVMDRFDIPATAIASFSFYNTRHEVDVLVAGLHKALEMFA